MRTYDALAAGYDGLMADGNYRRRAAFLERRLRKSPIPVETVLDLACGTGNLACLLAQRADRVVIHSSITARDFYLKMGYQFSDGVGTPDEEGCIRMEKKA